METVAVEQRRFNNARKNQAETLLTRAAACTRGFVKETGDGGSTSSHPMCAYSPIGVQALVVRKREALRDLHRFLAPIDREEELRDIVAYDIYLYVVRVTPVDSWHGGGGRVSHTSATSANIVYTST
uniref:Uncharacterized protein n=1 Tax=Trichogramma kaykai TaxID=54128 RepID=A0ABD2WWM1_9HYME